METAISLLHVCGEGLVRPEVKRFNSVLSEYPPVLPRPTRGRDGREADDDVPAVGVGTGKEAGPTRNPALSTIACSSFECGRLSA